MAEIVIIGAGLTGLSTAYHLEQLGIYDYLIFERHTRAGGLLRSESSRGFTFDHTGHLLHVNDQQFLTFLQTVVGIDNFNIVKRQTGIVSHDTITDYPFQINLHGLPTNVIIECINGYINRNKHIKQPASFYDWVKKHFGMGMGKHFFFPYNTKLLAYDLKQIHPSWTGRFVPSTNITAILQGTLEKNPPSGIGYNSSFYYPKQGGIEFLIKKLIDRITNPIITDHNVVSINTKAKKIFFQNGRQESYRHLISTMPLDHLIKKIEPASNHNFAPISAKLLCNSVININMGFNVDHGHKMHWLYFPEKQFPFYRLGFWENISKNSVPLNHAAVYGEVSYIQQKTSREQQKQLQSNTYNKMLQFLNIAPAHVICEKILHLDHAYVIYDAWREKNVPKILKCLAAMDIQSIGRYGAWKYSSMQEAVIDGLQAARAISITMQPLISLVPHNKKTTSMM